MGSQLPVDHLLVGMLEGSAEISTAEIDEQESAAPVEAKAPSEDKTSEPDESSENSSATDEES